MHKGRSESYEGNIIGFIVSQKKNSWGLGGGVELNCSGLQKPQFAGLCCDCFSYSKQINFSNFKL